jgi:aspartate kinase
MKIQKFGGSNFISKYVFENFVSILQKTEGNSIVVVSALGKTTRRLLEAARLAESGNISEAVSINEKLHHFTSNLIETIIDDDSSRQICLEEVNTYFEHIGKYLRNIGIIRELTPRVLDSVLSFGERISLRVFEHFCISKNLPFSAIDAGEIIITDDNFTSANPLQELIKENINLKILPLFAKSPIILTQGFIGKTQKGDYSTMGFESSNLTALLFAENLAANEITIWTDVEGVFNIDPNIWLRANQLSEMSFTEAKKAAKYGNKLFYPKMIDAAAQDNMEITYRSIHHPEGKFTKISPLTNSKSKMVNIYDDIFFLNINFFAIDEFTTHIFRKLMSKSDAFKYVSRFNDSADIFTNDTEIGTILNNSEIAYEQYICLTLINENILNLNKMIGEYSDLFLNLDYKLYPLEDGIYLLFIKKTSSRDISNILNVVL